MNPQGKINPTYFKHLKVLSCILLLGVCTNLHSQFSCVFSSSAGTSPYSTIINQPGNGTFSWSPANIWDNATGQIFLLTPFKFNGVNVTTCNYSANGYIWFGSGSNPADNTTAENVLGLPSIGANNLGIVAAFARDLGEHSSIVASPVPSNGGFGKRLIQYTVGGVIPNRYTIIEFAGFYPKIAGSGCTGGSLADNHRVDFQIKLYENNAAGVHPNRIEIIYRDQSFFCNDSPYSFQAGIRGVVPTDFFCRTQNGGNMTAASTTAGTANTDKIVFNGGDHVSTSGTSFIFDQTGITLSITPASASICSGASTSLSVSGANSFIWSPATGLSSTTGANVTASPTTTTMYTVTGSGGGCSATQTVTVNVTPGLAISVNPASASICNGTSTQLTASGATNYSWTPSTGLSSSSGATVTASPTTTTIYNVTGTTGGCSGTKDITVTVNNATNFTIIQNPAGFNNLCNGPIDLSVPSGFTTIFWSTNAATNSISATTPGLYSATARNLEGCTVQSNQLTINQTASPQINITPSGPQSLCNGALELSATPGMSTYNWSNAQSTSTITVSQAGDFSVICYDSQGCSGESDTVTVTGGSLPQVSISAPTNTICPGETILLTADPGFSSYLWNGGQTTESITVNQAGNYSVSVLDGGCSGSSPPFTLQPGLLPTAVFTYTQSTGYTIDFENTSTNATQFFWDFGNGNTSIEENTSHTFPFDGTYPVKLITQNACGSDTLLVNVVVLKLGLNELKGVELTLAPNPFLNQLSIEISLNTPTELTLTVHSLLGQLIYSEKIQGQASINRTIDFSKLASGIYSLQLQNQEGIRVRKVVKE